MATPPKESPARLPSHPGNIEFIDLMVTTMELLLDIRMCQRYGVADGAGKSGDPSVVLKPMWEEFSLLEAKLEMLLKQAQDNETPLPITRVAERYQLDRIEQQIFMLALAPAIEAGFRKRIARYKDNILMDYCDVDLVLSCLFETRQSRLSAMHYFGQSGRLIECGLIKPAVPRDSNHSGVLSQELRIPGRVLNYVLGVEDLDPALSGYCKMERPEFTLDQVVLPENTVNEVLSLADQFAGKLRSNVEQIKTPRGKISSSGVMQFCGPSGTGKTSLARALANHLNVPMLEVDCGKLAAEEVKFKSLIEDIFWQARLSGSLLVLDQCEAIMGKDNNRLPALFTEFERWDGLAVLCTNDVEKLDSGLERWVVYQFEFEQPEIPEREKLWALHLPTDIKLSKDVSVDEMASQYEINGNQIRNAVLVATNQALAESPGKPTITTDHLKRAAHTQMRASLSQYARRSKVRLTLDDLILPEEEKTDIKSILDAAKHRMFVMTKWGFGKKLTTGKGLVTMFCGEPGTGKTLCAEILAHELGLELYQISIPQVMSKYIGETEKNISQIFQTARANHAMLLFDEADSLFTSRVKVETSVDKFSNMETNLLLQEIERFEGVVVLTTNLDKSIDKAFQRRIQFRVNFPFPEAEYRARIWEHLFPEACPVDDNMDWDILGKSFEISGGHIKNAVLRSAYRAACTGGIVTMETVRFAAEQECKQAGKLFRSFKLEHELEGGF